MSRAAVPRPTGGTGGHRNSTTGRAAELLVQVHLMMGSGHQLHCFQPSPEDQRTDI